MDLPPFLLNQWLESHLGANHALAGSTGPRWTAGDILALGERPPDLGAVALDYGSPEGEANLREEIARYQAVDPDWVVVTNGASEAVLLVLLALASTGGNVVLPFPGYPAFAGAGAAMRLPPRLYRLDRERGFGLDADAVAGEADDETVLVVANSPHNPTGAIVPHGECAALADALGEKGTPLLVDEVYHPIYFGEPNPSAATLENVIVVGDMSKALALPGMRIGWVIDRDAARRERMINARSHLTVSSSPILEALALHALRNRDAILQRTRSIAAANLASLTGFMDEMRDVLEWVPPRGGLQAFPWFRDGRDSRPFCDRLAEKGVALMPGDCFGMPDHARIGFGSQAGGIDAALDIVGRELRR
jgi:aspartate/methionine/tyrosine aminotransferase